MNRFAICISADKEILLTPRKIYQVLPDEKTESSDYIRVIDDEGRLSPKKFVFVSIPKEIENTLLQSA